MKAAFRSCFYFFIDLTSVDNGLRMGGWNKLPVYIVIFRNF